MEDIKKYEIIDEELESIAGGKFTKEAYDWYDRNRHAIQSRLNEKNPDSVYISLNVYMGLSNEETVYNISGLKRRLKDYGINCDDLT